MAASDSNALPLLALPHALAALIFGFLQPRDLARFACCCKASACAVLAAPWRQHCQALLGEVLVSFVGAKGISGGKPGQQDQELWHGLYRASRQLDELHWCEPLPQQLTSVSASASAPPTASLLARAAHRAVAIGSRYVVLLGGLTRDAGLYQLDVAVLDAAGSMIRPVLQGQPPPALSHLCASCVTLLPGSLLHSQVAAAAAAAASSITRKQQQGNLAHHHQQQQQQQQHRASTPSHACSPDVSCGHTLMLFGGLQHDGTDVGGAQLTFLWLAADASWGTWLTVTSSGQAPAPRAHACSQALAGGRTLLVYSGVVGSLAGTAVADVVMIDSFLLLCVYLLDVNALTWRKQPTWPLNEPPVEGHVMIGPSTCPGPRKQALCCRRVSPLTGNEEFIVLGGCGKDGLADFVPYALDTTDFVWRKGAVTGYLPSSREAGALLQLSDEWLLVLGGHSPSGQPLADIQRLHLPSLSWRPPPKVSASPAAAEQATSSSLDFTATAGFVVGGLRQGPFGDVIVPRLGVLLPGPPWQGGAGTAGQGDCGTTACGNPNPAAAVESQPLLAASSWQWNAAEQSFSRDAATAAAGPATAQHYHAPAGWVSEIEIEPAPVQGRVHGSVTAAAAAAAGASSGGDMPTGLLLSRAAGAGGNEWQPAQPSGSQSQQLLQLVVALAVLLLAVLFAPSIVMSG